MSIDIKQAFSSMGSKKENMWLKFKAGNYYKLRLVPYYPELSESVYNYYMYWNNTTKKAICTLSDDNILTKFYRDNFEKDEVRARKCKPNEQVIVNAYLVDTDDMEKSDYRGEVVVVKLSKTLRDIIVEQATGEKSTLITDVSDKGYNLYVKVRNANGFPSYSQSYVESEPSGLDEDQEFFKENVSNLKDYITIATEEDLEKYLEVVKEQQ